jgi:hypothetical protein
MSFGKGPRIDGKPTKDQSRIIYETYAKASLKKYRPMACAAPKRDAGFVTWCLSAAG